MTDPPLPSIIAATRRYEAWLRLKTRVVSSDLRAKHVAMASGEFPFLRATFYRWCQLWQHLGSSAATGPRLLAVGDLHVENFGTWRDAEGRLVWGINDVDEAFPMVYTNDLVRLATSARLAIRAGRLGIGRGEACDLILDGYRDALQCGGRPFVLDGRQPALRAHALSEQRRPAIFWAHLEGLPLVRSRVPAGALERLHRALPPGHGRVRLVRRRSGVGSLGHQRVVALTTLHGGRIAREAKASVPAAMVWLGGGPARPLDPDRLLRRAIRCPDPHFTIDGRWEVRRLAPDCSRIELDARLGAGQERGLLRAMGFETGNLHAGGGATRAILRDLAGRPPDWLLEASKRMARAVAADFDTWAAHHRRLANQKP